MFDCGQYVFGALPQCMIFYIVINVVGYNIGTFVFVFDTPFI